MVHGQLWAERKKPVPVGLETQSSRLTSLTQQQHQMFPGVKRQRRRDSWEADRGPLPGPGALNASLLRNCGKARPNKGSVLSVYIAKSLFRWQRRVRRKGERERDRNRGKEKQTETEIWSGSLYPARRLPAEP